MAFFKFKKNKLWLWKSYCRDIGQLIYRECGACDQATLEKLMERLKKWPVTLYCADHWPVYPKVIDENNLKHSKAETKAIERITAHSDIGWPDLNGS